MTMKIAVVHGLSGSGALGYLGPIRETAGLERVISFSYTGGNDSEKIVDISPMWFRNKLLKNIQKVLQMMRKINRDCALIIGIYEIPHGLLALFIGKLKRITVAITMMGNPGYEKFRKGLRKKLMYFILKHSDIITVTGSNSKNILVRNGVPAERIHILPNTVDVEKFDQQDIPQVYSFINLGRLDSVKRMDNLLIITKKMVEQDPDFLLGIAGKGPEFENIHTLISQMDLERNVHLLGFVDDTVRFYNSGKVFIITSETEGLPRTLLEAMACGRPSIVPDVGDISDVAIDGFNADLIRPFDNIDGYVEKARTLLTNDILYNKYAENAYSYVRDKYSFSSATRVWDEIFTQHNLNK